MFGGKPRVKPKVVSPNEELYDLCGYPIQGGTRSKPVGPDRKVYFRVSSRSKTTPLSTTTKGKGKAAKMTPLEREQAEEMAKVRLVKKHFRQGLTNGWYDTSKGEGGLIGTNAKGPGVADFQKSQQMQREGNLLPGYSAKTIRENFPSSHAGETGASVPRSIARSENWDTDYDFSDQGPPKPHPVQPIVTSTIFGTMKVESPAQLKRNYLIQQENISTTRRLRAGLPEPIEGMAEVERRAFAKEAKRLQHQEDHQRAVSSLSMAEAGVGANSLMPVSHMAGTISVKDARPFERQLYNRKVRDAIIMEKELEKLTQHLTVDHVKKFVPAYRMQKNSGLENSF